MSNCPKSKVPFTNREVSVSWNEHKLKFTVKRKKKKIRPRGVLISNYWKRLSSRKSSQNRDSKRYRKPLLCIRLYPFAVTKCFHLSIKELGPPFRCGCSSKRRIMICRDMKPFGFYWWWSMDVWIIGSVPLSFNQRYYLIYAFIRRLHECSLFNSQRYIYKQF